MGRKSRKPMTEDDIAQYSMMGHFKLDRAPGTSGAPRDADTRTTDEESDDRDMGPRRTRRAGDGSVYNEAMLFTDYLEDDGELVPVAEQVAGMDGGGSTPVLPPLPPRTNLPYTQRRSAFSPSSPGGGGGGATAMRRSSRGRSRESLRRTASSPAGWGRNRRTAPPITVNAALSPGAPATHTHNTRNTHNTHNTHNNIHKTLGSTTPPMAMVPEQLQLQAAAAVAAAQMSAQSVMPPAAYMGADPMGALAAAAAAAQHMFVQLSPPGAAGVQTMLPPPMRQSGRWLPSLHEVTAQLGLTQPPQWRAQSTPNLFAHRHIESVEEGVGELTIESASASPQLSPTVQSPRGVDALRKRQQRRIKSEENLLSLSEATRGRTRANRRRSSTSRLLRRSRSPSRSRSRSRSRSNSASSRGSATSSRAASPRPSGTGMGSGGLPPVSPVASSLVSGSSGSPMTMSSMFERRSSGSSGAGGDAMVS